MDPTEAVPEGGGTSAGGFHRGNIGGSAGSSAENSAGTSANPAAQQSCSYAPPPSPVGAERLPVGPYESPAHGLPNMLRNVLIYAGIPLTKAEVEEAVSRSWTREELEAVRVPPPDPNAPSGPAP